MTSPENSVTVTNNFVVITIGNYVRRKRIYHHPKLDETETDLGDPMFVNTGNLQIFKENIYRDVQTLEVTSSIELLVTAAIGCREVGLGRRMAQKCSFVFVF